MKIKMKGGDNESISNFAIIIIFFIFFGFCITFIILIATQKSSIVPLQIIYPITGEKTITITAEKSKNTSSELNPYNTFPPCFDLSVDAKKVFQILKATKMDVKYIQLLDVYSLTLCQLQDFQTSCTSENTLKQINQRLSTLDSWKADVNNAKAISIVNSVTHITKPSLKTSQFLFKVCDICEKNINAIQQDNTFNTATKTQILGFNSEFYRTIFDNINKLCTNI